MINKILQQMANENTAKYFFMNQNQITKAKQIRFLL